MKDDEFDRIVRTNLQKLETIHPKGFGHPGALWESMAEKRTSRARPFKWNLAASILILAIAGYGIYTLQQDLVGSHESTQSAISERDEVTEALDFIATRCAASKDLCADADFQQLHNDLEKSLSEMEVLEDLLRRYPGDPRLARAKKRIETHQYQVIRTLVQIL